MEFPDTINPYRSRGPIENPRFFFGREQEILAICDAIQCGGTNGSPASVSIVGERRIGKSSLLRYVHNKENRKKRGLDRNYAFAFVDFSMLGYKPREITPKMFFGSILESFQRDPGAKLVKESSFDDFRNAIFRIAKKRKVVIFLDEFDLITRSENFDEGFFLALRGMAQEPIYRMGIITSSLRNLWAIVHHVDLAASPFFNIFNTVFLKAFNEKEALELIRKPFQIASVPLSTEEVDIILDLAGFHPLFLQIACSSIFEEKRLSKDFKVPSLGMVRRRFEEEAEVHFQALCKHLGREEKLVLKDLARNRVKKKYLSTKRELVKKGYIVDDRVFSSSFIDFLNTRTVSTGTTQAFFKNNLGTIIVLVFCLMSIALSLRIETKKLTLVVVACSSLLVAVTTLLNHVVKLKEAVGRLFKLNMTG